MRKGRREFAECFFGLLSVTQGVPPGTELQAWGGREAAAAAGAGRVARRRAFRQLERILSRIIGGRRGKQLPADVGILPTLASQ